MSKRSRSIWMKITDGAKTALKIKFDFKMNYLKQFFF